MAKFTKPSFCQKLFFWYQTSTCKSSDGLYCVGKVSNSFRKTTVIQVDFPVCALSIWQKSYKMAKFDKQPYCLKLFLFAGHRFMHMLNTSVLL